MKRYQLVKTVKKKKKKKSKERRITLCGRAGRIDKKGRLESMDIER